MKKNSSNIKLIWLLFYIFVFCFFLRNSFNYLDPDFGWHLKVGQEILNSKKIPTIEHFDYTLAGKNWVDHEWLTNAIVYFIYNYANYITLSIIFALLVVITLLLINLYIKKYLLGLNDGFLLLLAMIPLETLGVLAISPHTGVRMQELGLLFLTLLLIIIKTFEKNKNWKRLVWLVPLLYVWSCLHGSFLIGFFILGLYLAIKLAESFIDRFSWSSFLDFSNLMAKKDLLILSGFSAISFIATLLTPYGLNLYLFLLDYTNNFYAKHIAEWLSAFTYPFQYYQLLYLAITSSILLIYFLDYRYAKKRGFNFLARLDLWSFFSFIFFLFLAIKSKRHFPLFFIISLPTLAQIIIPGLKQIKLKISLNNWFTKTYLLITFLLLIALLLLTTNFTNLPFSNTKFCQYYPCAALKFLKDQPDYQQLTIFNSYNWGGYLIWTWPEKQLFIDGRLPQYPLKDHTFLEEYYEFFTKEKTAKKLDEYDIQLILLRIDQPTKVKSWEKILFGVNEEKINDGLNYLKNYFDKSADWQVVYQDDIARVYLKNKK